jgi:type I restriction enzyme S subunit
LIQLSFKQTRSELMLRTASTLLFTSLERHNVAKVPLRTLIEGVQYGYTASATSTPVGPRFVRITDLKDGRIHWSGVPYCDCPDFAPYALKVDDILFARTGATTGKTHFVNQLAAEPAVFASYLIRVRPNRRITPGYLAAFFLSEQYWAQVVEQKEGSAQPNVNGDKLSRMLVPLADAHIQTCISLFMDAVAHKFSDPSFPLPELPPPLTEQRPLLERIDTLASKIHEARELKHEAVSRRVSLWLSALESEFANLTHSVQPLATILRRKKREVVLHPGAEYLPAGLTNQAKGIIAYPSISCSDTKYTSLFELAEGDLVYSKLKVWEGSLAIVPSKDKGRVVSSEFPTFEVAYDRVHRDYLDLWLRRPSLWKWLGDQVRGIGGRKIRVDEPTFLSAPIPLPPISQQEAVAARLQDFRQKTLDVKSFQNNSSVELEALLPAILDRAFRGELLT